MWHPNSGTWWIQNRSKSIKDPSKMMSEFGLRKGVPSLTYFGCLFDQTSIEDRYKIVHRLLIDVFSMFDRFLTCCGPLRLKFFFYKNIRSISWTWAFRVYETLIFKISRHALGEQNRKKMFQNRCSQSCQAPKKQNFLRASRTCLRQKRSRAARESENKLFKFVAKN